MSKYYIDTCTGTWGYHGDLMTFDHEPPLDFDNWTDSDRIEWTKLNGGKHLV